MARHSAVRLEHNVLTSVYSPDLQLTSWTARKAVPVSNFFFSGTSHKT